MEALSSGVASSDAGYYAHPAGHVSDLGRRRAMPTAVALEVNGILQACEQPLIRQVDW
jgi:hypothetical protein